MLKKLYRFLRLTTQRLVYSYCGFIILYFFLRLIFWDRLWIVAFIGSFIPLILLPILLLPLPAFFLIKKPGFSIVSSIACIWLLGWLHLAYFSPQNAANINNYNSQPLKIFTLNNSWHKTEPKTLVEVIQRERPDIVFLQEITKPHITKSFPQLKAEYPYQTSEDKKGYRAAILSKYPILLTENIHLAGHQEVQQRAIIEINKKPIVAYNIQTISPWIRPQKILPFLTIPTYVFSDRSAEIQDLRKRIKRETLPVIAAGDFNFTDSTQDYYYLSQVLEDAFSTSGFGFGFTWPTGWESSFLFKNSNGKFSYPLFRIDYIWHSKDWLSLSTKVLPTTGSDHLPVVGELVLSPSRNQVFPKNLVSEIAKSRNQVFPKNLVSEIPNN
jgi:endonuclease/exonuclease/phosphatase (EEP) superfamily protein YafD